MSAQDILSRIEEELRRVVPDITFGYGKPDLARHGAPPRVTWVPADGSFGPYQPADMQDDEPQAIHVDKATYVVHCWAETDANGRDANAESLGHKVIAAIRRVLSGGHYELGGNTRDDGGNNGANGWLYLFVVSIVVPVLEDPAEMATLNEMPFDTTETPPNGVLQAPGD